MRRDVFQAIADPTRREIINLVAGKSLTPNNIAETFETSRQAISKHIKILTECGIITISQKGRERYCTIDPEKLNVVAGFLNEFKKIWEQRFNRLDDLLADMQTNIDNHKNETK